MCRRQLDVCSYLVRKRALDVQVRKICDNEKQYNVVKSKVIGKRRNYRRSWLLHGFDTNKIADWKVDKYLKLIMEFILFIKATRLSFPLTTEHLSYACCTFV